MAKITGKSIIGKVIQKYSGTEKIFAKYEMACVYCPVAASESVERGALAHGIDKVRLRKMLEELNKVA